MDGGLGFPDSSDPSCVALSIRQRVGLPSIPPHLRVSSKELDRLTRLRNEAQGRIPSTAPSQPRDSDATCVETAHNTLRPTQSMPEKNVTGNSGKQDERGWLSKLKLKRKP